MPDTSERETSRPEAYERSRLLLAEQLEAVEQRLLRICGPEANILGQAARGAVEAGGKRLRPLLVLLCARAVADPNEDSEGIAAAVEVMHLASLMHDDVVDEATVRRGAPAVRARWGNRVAVLAGDYLAARAYWELNSLKDRDYLEILAHVAMDMCLTEGDLARGAGAVLTPEDCLRVARGKTAGLLAACCRLGALSVGADPEVAQAFWEYGESYGMAFQLTDDLLDIYGDEDVLGKRPGQDIASGQLTYPLAVALRSPVAGELRRALSAFRAGEEPSGDLQQVRELVSSGGGEAQTQAQVESYVSRAVAALQAVAAADSRVITALEGLVRALPKRRY